MNTNFLIIFLSLFCLNAFSVAQSPQLGTNRSEGLQIKAKMDYEKKTDPVPQPKVERKQAVVPIEKVNSDPKPLSAPAVAKAESSAKLTCKNGNEVRELLLDKKGSGCELVYVKAGQRKTQAHQNNGTNVCETVLEKMKATLEKTGFKCESKKD